MCHAVWTEGGNNARPVSFTQFTGCLGYPVERGGRVTKRQQDPIAPCASVEAPIIALYLRLKIKGKLNSRPGVETGVVAMQIGIQLPTIGQNLRPSLPESGFQVLSRGGSHIRPQSKLDTIFENADGMLGPGAAGEAFLAQGSRDRLCTSLYRSIRMFLPQPFPDCPQGDVPGLEHFAIGCLISGNDGANLFSVGHETSHNRLIPSRSNVRFEQTSS